MNPYNIKTIDGEDVAIRNEDYWKKKEQEKFELYLIRSGIPKNYWDIDFIDYQGDKSIDSKNKCEQYAKRCLEEKFHNINLYLCGGNGDEDDSSGEEKTHNVQKSMCACAIGKEFLRQGLKVQFVYAGKLLDLLLKTQGFNYEERFYNQLQKIIDVDLLIIDDVFDTRKSQMFINNPDTTIALWDTFLRSFIHEDKRIVMTSNYSMNMIKKKFGESIHQLIERDFLQLMFYDDIKIVRRKRFENIWE